MTLGVAAKAQEAELSSPDGENTTEVVPDDDQNTDAEDEQAQAALAAAQAAEAEDDGLPEAVRRKLNKTNREAANLRARIKELEPLALEAKTLRESQMSEVEKLKTQLDEREQELSMLRVERVRAQAGMAAKLDPDMWEFITSDDLVEATQQAKRLVARLVPPDPGRGDLRQGARGSSSKQPEDPNVVLRRMAGYDA